MANRLASLVVVLVFVVTVPARAQGPSQPPAGSVAAQLAALQARVDKLEGNIVAADLAGTYSLLFVDTQMTALDIGPPVVNATIRTRAGGATMTLNPDFTGHTSNWTCEAGTLTQGAWTVSGTNCSGPSTLLSWSYANGVITIKFLDENEDLPFNVALGGRLLTLAFASFHPADRASDQGLLIATRLR